MKKLVLIYFLFHSLVLQAQDSLLAKSKWDMAGYLKELGWTRFDKNFKGARYTNLLHNRINIKWNPSTDINSRLELRNRFYWGDDVNSIPFFRDQLKNTNEAVDISKTWLSNASTILHTDIERLWLEFRQPKWNMRVGRQRINWGIANTWNPNDLFNTYNFLDFDYEERAGSDAARFQWLPNDLSHVELAIAGTGDHPIVAAKYFINSNKYDWQGIIGSFRNIITVGLGWAGSISEVGFKGEAQYYIKNDTASRLNVTVETDYMLNNGWYLLSAILYNDKGLNKPLEDLKNISFNASPRSLMPAQWNILFGTSKEITPLFNGNFNVVYSPGINMIILFPSFTYNLLPNVDGSLVWQSFFAEINHFQALSHTGFLRVKWSF